jgi:predicted TIM-barrel fold metal-dependent hydrolase
MVLSRRAFVASSLAALLADEKPKKTVPVVDAHVHCFAGSKSKEYPYHKDAPYKPADAATPKALLEAMDGAGVDHAVIVHPEPYQDDHAYLEHCLKQDGKRLKGTCLFFASKPDAPKKLAALAKKCSLVALRVHAYAPERQPPFGKPELKALWKQAADLGLAVQIHFEPRYAAGFEPYLKEFAKTTVIVDHLGRPFQGTPKEHKVVLAWGGKFENAVMKISSVPEPERYPHRKIAPVVKGLTEAYGAARLIYGGGWGAGVAAKAYRAERERIAKYLAHLSDDERAAVFGGNAAKLFGFAS